VSVHTGWAASVVAGGDLRAPRIDARDLIEMLDDPDRFVFHRAAELGAADARRAVESAKQEAHARAREAVSRIALRMRGAGLTLQTCAIVAKGGAMLPLEDIVLAHPRIHTGEGMFYRDALAAAAESAGLRVVLVSPNELEAKTATSLGVTRARVTALLAEAARVVGKPWAKDQKLAAMAAWLAVA
jgi:hypothetical protein